MTYNIDTSIGPAVQYYILTRSPSFKQVLEWLQEHDIRVDIHINRTRFTLDTRTKLYTEFCLRFSTECSIVDPTLDLATGLPLSTI